jgi:hypothetical protein
VNQEAFAFGDVAFWDIHVESVVELNPSLMSERRVKPYSDVYQGRRAFVAVAACCHVSGEVTVETNVSLSSVQGYAAWPTHPSQLQLGNKGFFVSGS